MVVQTRTWNFWGEYAWNLQLSYENNTWDHIIHALTIDGPNELQQCKLLGASYVQRVVRVLNDCFPNILIFNTILSFIIIEMMIVIESQIPNCGSKNIVEVSTHSKRKWHKGITRGTYRETLQYEWEQKDIWGLAHMW